MLAVAAASAATINSAFPQRGKCVDRHPELYFTFDIMYGMINCTATSDHGSDFFTFVDLQIPPHVLLLLTLSHFE